MHGRISCSGMCTILTAKGPSSPIDIEDVATGDEPVPVNSKPQTDTCAVKLLEALSKARQEPVYEEPHGSGLHVRDLLFSCCDESCALMWTADDGQHQWENFNATVGRYGTLLYYNVLYRAAQCCTE